MHGQQNIKTVRQIWIKILDVYLDKNPSYKFWVDSIRIFTPTGRRDKANTNFSQRSVNAPNTQNCLRPCSVVRWLYTSVLSSAFGNCNMVRSDIKFAITLCYPCVPISSLGPENVMIYGVECWVDRSMILAGVLLKLGGYGLLSVFPVLFRFGFRFGVVWVALSLVGGLFVSLFCIRQTDLKSLIAYSSVAHISIVIGGIMTLNYWGVCK